MALNVEWGKPIHLPRDGKYSLTIDVGSVPNRPGVYMFFCRIGKNTTQVVYVGKGLNVQQRTKNHQANHSVIRRLLETGDDWKSVAKARFYLMAGSFKNIGGQDPEKCIKTVERVLIKTLLEDGHPLTNIHGTRIKTDKVVSVLPPGTKFLSPEIPFEPSIHKKTAVKKVIKKTPAKRK